MILKAPYVPRNSVCKWILESMATWRWEVQRAAQPPWSSPGSKTPTRNWTRSSQGPHHWWTWSRPWQSKSPPWTEPSSGTSQPFWTQPSLHSSTLPRCTFPPPAFPAPLPRTPLETPATVQICLWLSRQRRENPEHRLCIFSLELRLGTATS